MRPINRLNFRNPLKDTRAILAPGVNLIILIDLFVQPYVGEGFLIFIAFNTWNYSETRTIDEISNHSSCPVSFLPAFCPHSFLLTRPFRIKSRHFQILFYIYHFNMFLWWINVSFTQWNLFPTWIQPNKFTLITLIF